MCSETKENHENAPLLTNRFGMPCRSLLYFLTATFSHPLLQGKVHFLPLSLLMLHLLAQRGSYNVFSQKGVVILCYESQQQECEVSHLSIPGLQV